MSNFAEAYCLWFNVMRLVSSLNISYNCNIFTHVRYLASWIVLGTYIKSQMKRSKMTLIGDMTVL